MEKIPIRQIKAVGQCGVGSIVQVGDYTLTPCDTRQWQDRDGRWFGETIWGVKRLEQAIGQGKRLRRPPVIHEAPGHRIIGDLIPAVRFPSWMYCPKCGRLHRFPWKEAEDPKYPVCRDEHCTGPRLVTVSWVMISYRGYMSDLPFGYLAHREAIRQEQKDCRDRDHLYLTREGATRRRLLSCRSCRARADISGLLDKNFLLGLESMDAQPWDFTEKSLTSPLAQAETGDFPRLLAVELTDSRIHLPEIISLLDIPPESRIDPSDLRARLQQYDKLDELMEIKDNEAPLARRLRRLAHLEFNCSPEDLRAAFNDIAGGWPFYDDLFPSLVGQGDLLRAEYKAFLTPYPALSERERFVTSHLTDKWREYYQKPDLSPLARGLGRAFSNLVIARRLREVQALLGFRRISGQAVLIPPDLTGELDWLPACELFGEGVFFTLEEEILGAWEKEPAVIRRAADLRERFEKSLLSAREGIAVLSPRFLLLHTWAHLIIRQLEFDCGYTAASIKERIYCRRPGPENPEGMAGILIYVAVPDKAGSLGGLTLQGQPENLAHLLLHTLEKARWCSLDPVCAEHQGQGPDQLNRAACHACCLLPETSCIHANCLLDRLFLRGDPETGLPGFIDYLIRAGS